MAIQEALEEYINANYQPHTVQRAELLLEQKESFFSYEQITDAEYVVYVPPEKGNAMVRVYLNQGSRLFVSCSYEACRKSPTRTCWHAFAAMFFLEEELTEEDVDFDFDEYEEFDKAIGSHTDKEGYAVFSMSGIVSHQVIGMCGNSREPMRPNYYSNVEPVDTTTAHQRFRFMEKKVALSIEILYDGKGTFRTKCSCRQKQPLLCTHVAACFVYLAETHGHYYFNRFRDFTEEKNNVLKRYGLTVNDPEADFFKWDLSWDGSIVLKSAPSFLIPAGETSVYEEIKNSILGTDAPTYATRRPVLAEDVMIDYDIGFVLNFTSSRNFGFEVETAFVRDKNYRQHLKKLSIHQSNNWPYLQALPDEVYDVVLGLNEQNLLNWLEENGGSRAAAFTNPWAHIVKSDRDKLRKRYFDLLLRLWPFVSEWPFVFALKEGTFSNKNLLPAKLGKEGIHLNFTAEADKRFVTITCRPFLEAQPAVELEVSVWGDFLFEINNVFHLPASADDLPLLERFNNGMIKFPVSEMKNVIINVIAPLQARYKVELKGLPDVIFVTSEPQPRIMLSELNEQYLMIRPQFLYDDVIVSYDNDEAYVEESGEQLKVVQRHKSVEKKLYEYLRALHPKFSNQRNNLYYYLLFKDVMVNNWFLNAIKIMQDAGFPVYGLQELKKFRYNPGKPKFEITAGSGVDWFDLKISVSWGDQQLSLKDIRKAIINNQDAVLLGDGTLGVIPKEWLKQYRPLMKIASEEKGSLCISKLHYTLLDDINDRLDSEEVKKEIEEKKKRLLCYDQVKCAPPSSHIKAVLRPYQLSGFKWLQALDDMKWGGCLADDMGLGKTLQAITFLQYLKEKYPGSTHLVICPTSLIFNWESELQKFCPSLQYHVYYGLQRTFDDEHFDKFDIVLTTYGMVRNDLDQLKQFQWHYIVLDESQAIKNPEALTTRAVQNLRSRNRIILSGTPVQNNTYDLYAQFTFLNPGFLGSREFFKSEFAQPIDKNGDKEKAAQLRRMIYPFMLRRTKAQVATDLPAKTEMVLWCSMEREQRNIYDRYKEHYRQLLLKKIDEEGIAKAGIYVLEGLLRLRQICDHPALLKDKNLQTSNSIKTDELLREIQENAGDHKLLVFSQFTEMLAIVRVALAKAKMTFCYLDGGTPIRERKKQVTEFQENESIKIFLISLKAGGVGLNLTAADYVYLIDPWWNPAAEQQAIDRTHRIGQAKKIFAYKMICKDTVEEKILHLQERKKLLASELISEDAGFVKKLTREDIAYLFS